MTFELLGRRSTHDDRLERFLGVEQVRVLSEAGRGWYGPPIPLVGVPGGVHLRGGEAGGDFVGPIDGGVAGNLFDFLANRLRGATRRATRNQQTRCNTGLTSLGDLIAEATAGKKRHFTFHKSGVVGVIGSSNTLWYEGAQPVSGAVGGAAPGGTAHDDSNAGAFLFSNPTGGDTQHLTKMESFASVAGNTLLLYDRLFSVAKTMNSTATEAVTGVPTRYQGSGGADYAAGNILFIECSTGLPATAHNWTVCTYLDQDGNAATLPAITGNSSNIAKRLDMPAQQWFAPLASGDTGIQALTQMQCSAAVATGAITFVIGRPLAMLCHPVINMMWTLDGVTGSFNLERIFDDACLAFLEINKPTTTATTYSGIFESVSG